MAALAASTESSSVPVGAGAGGFVGPTRAANRLALSMRTVNGRTMWLARSYRCRHAVSGVRAVGASWRLSAAYLDATAIGLAFGYAVG